MRIFRRLLLADPGHGGVGGAREEAIPLLGRVAQEYQVRLRGGFTRSRIPALIVPGAIHNQRDILITLQELFEHAAVEEDIAIQDETTAPQLGFGTEQRGEVEVFFVSPIIVIADVREGK